MNAAPNGIAPISDDDAISAVMAGLAARGYPITVQRKLLVAVIMGHDRPFTAEGLLEALDRQGARIGRATVFRTLDLLVQLGYLHRMAEDQRSAYIACTPDHHHHLVCSGCGNVVHLEECPINDALADLEARTGYHINRHTVELSGVCPACQQRS